MKYFYKTWYFGISSVKKQKFPIHNDDIVKIMLNKERLLVQLDHF